jgi:hypothetical protein
MANAESANSLRDAVHPLPNDPICGSCTNGCNTQHYFLGREPEFFKGTQIFIDSFHSDQTLLADCTTQVRTFDLEGALYRVHGARTPVCCLIRCVLGLLCTMGRACQC